MKTTNANSDFQDFSKCDYSLHWSWSNFFRHIAVCNSMLEYKDGDAVLEIGAADSPIEDMLRINFRRKFNFTKTDVNSKYENQMSIFDVEHEGLIRYKDASFSCVIMTEVIEHFDPKNATFVLNEIRRVLKPGGKLLLTTPTPLKPSEQLVWSDDHEFEYSWEEIADLVSHMKFSIKKVMPWSMHKKMYEQSTDRVTSDCLPLGLNRALCSLSTDCFSSRQIFMELIKED